MILRERLFRHGHRSTGCTSARRGGPRRRVGWNRERLAAAPRRPPTLLRALGVLLPRAPGAPACPPVLSWLQGYKDDLADEEEIAAAVEGGMTDRRKERDRARGGRGGRPGRPPQRRREERNQERNRRFDTLMEAWRRNHPSAMRKIGRIGRRRRMFFWSLPH